MRFKIISTRSKPASRFLVGSPLEALAAAQELSEEHGYPFLVAEAPEKGLVRVIATVGDQPEKKGRKKAA